MSKKKHIEEVIERKTNRNRKTDRKKTVMERCKGPSKEQRKSDRRWVKDEARKETRKKERKVTKEGWKHLVRHCTFSLKVNLTFASESKLAGSAGIDSSTVLVSTATTPVGIPPNLKTPPKKQKNSHKEAPKTFHKANVSVSVDYTWLCPPPHSEPMAAWSPWRSLGQRIHSATNPLDLHKEKSYERQDKTQSFIQTSREWYTKSSQINRYMIIPSPSISSTCFWILSHLILFLLCA